MKKINIKAVIIGTLVDIGSSIAFGVAIGIVVGIIYASSNGSMEGFEEYSVTNVTLLTTYLIVGLACVSLGGYVAGKIAKENETVNALAVGVIAILLGILFTSYYPVWFNAASFALILPFAYFGGILSSRAKQPNEA
jgi:ABC-type multidrug transport system permease subunit